jgi:hypothetical protein
MRLRQPNLRAKLYLRRVRLEARRQGVQVRGRRWDGPKDVSALSTPVVSPAERASGRMGR